MLTFVLLAVSVFVIDIQPGKDIYADAEPYMPKTKWAMKGVKIGQARNPGPRMDCSVINATHAWNSQGLIAKLKGQYTFGQEHSTARKDHKRVRHARKGPYPISRQGDPPLQPGP